MGLEVITGTLVGFVGLVSIIGLSGVITHLKH